MLDTQFFDENFKAQLIASIEDFDEQCDGLLIHSENFQALNLLQERYKEQVKCVYIDPPYNTGGDGFLYKDSYFRSSWLSMIFDRLLMSAYLFNQDAALFASIDDNEVGSLNNVIQNIFGLATHVTNIAARINPRGRTLDKYLAKNHEYVSTFSLYSGGDSILEIPKGDKALKEYNLEDEEGVYRALELRNRNPVFNRSNRPNLFYPIYTRPEGGEVSLEKTEDFLIEIYPRNSKGEDGCWTWSTQKFRNKNQDVFARKAKTGAWRVFRKDRIKKDQIPTTKAKSIWLDKEINNENGKELLGNMFGKVAVSFPKALGLMLKILRIGSNNNGLILDYFAGSGTTGHAIINLNREDSGKRKYILIEMGNYFDTVLKPRLAKVAYASDWKNGKPVTRDTGISHCFKYIRLESYEDTLGNLALNTKQDLFANNDKAREAYLLNYMLNVETRGSQSLLNTQQFLEPTQYQLNVRTAGGDETKAINVDLLETFNYLLGLTVEHIAAPIYFNAELSQGEFGRWQAKVKREDNGKWWFRTVYGTNPNGQKVLVVWRNLPSVIAGDEQGLQFDNAVLDAVLIEKLAIRLTESLDDEIDILYVNGDHNIAIPRDRKGQPMEQARLQLIEEAFHRLMFADTESVQ